MPVQTREQSDPVLIIGGGIGGLVTALSLHQAGFPCKVFESAEYVRPLGVGINVLPHAVRELTELGLRAQIEKHAVATAELAYYSKRGDLIWSEPRGEAAGYHWPQFSVHRGKLQMLLHEACVERIGQDNVLSGHHLRGWESTEKGVTARFASEPQADVTTSCHGRALIGADGIHSTVRQTLYPEEGPPIWNGAILWRGISRGPAFLTGRTMIMAGHEFQKFVCYPIEPHAVEPAESGVADDADGADGGDAVLNWVAEKKYPIDRPWRREDWNRAGDLDEFLPDFAPWEFPWLSVPTLITSAERVFEYPMVDRDPLPKWTFGRVTLLGDAAHPMYPIGSNGASQAILDARVLARELLGQGVNPAALKAYEAERREATTRIVLANRGNGPEQVMQLVEERAPGGFERVEDVLSAQELEDTAARYKQLAGFDKNSLNERPPIVVVRTQ